MIDNHFVFICFKNTDINIRMKFKHNYRQLFFTKDQNTE